MKLGRLVPTSKIEIRAPRWKDRVVGIASHRLAEHMEIEILAADKYGKRYYPDTYYLSQDQVIKNGVHQVEQQVINGLVIWLVPISKLSILQRVDDDKL